MSVWVTNMSDCKGDTPSTVSQGALNLSHHRYLWLFPAINHSLVSLNFFINSILKHYLHLLIDGTMLSYIFFYYPHFKIPLIAAEKFLIENFKFGWHYCHMNFKLLKRFRFFFFLIFNSSFCFVIENACYQMNNNSFVS